MGPGDADGGPVELHLLILSFLTAALLDNPYLKAPTDCLVLGKVPFVSLYLSKNV